MSIRFFQRQIFNNSKALNSIIFKKIGFVNAVTPYHFRNLYNQLLKSPFTNIAVPANAKSCRLYSSYNVNPLRNALTASGYERPIAFWLMGCSSLTLVIMLLGSYTRLTESGLSMIEWKPLGSILPRTDDDWLDKFDKYKETPEYRTVHTNITIDEFKGIYFTEWLHRLVARATGLIFISGLIYFNYFRAIKPPLQRPLIAIGILGASQAIIGMVMVKSGLVEPQTGEIARVSPLILSFHFITALSIYSLCFWNALSILRPNAAIKTAAKLNIIENIDLIKKLTYVLSGVSLVTFFSGAIVAGNDSGFICNTWPKINDKFVPDEFTPLKTGFNGFLSNPVIVQFNHRSLAYLTGLTSIALSVATLKSKNMPSKIKKSVFYVLISILVQMILGIDTLIRGVPVYMGVAHQFGAVSVWTCILHLLKRL